MWLIAGLGNPGAGYAKHRHNAGFMVLDAIAGAYGAGAWKAKQKGEVAEAAIAGEKCLLAKPQTFMNLSGQAIQPLMQFYKIPPANLLVLHDELDLKLGQCRIKQGGGHGGHNGLRDIDERIGKEYWRLRIGISHPGDKDRVHDHVLSNFTKDERMLFDEVSAALVQYLPLFFTHSPAAMMSKVADAVNRPLPDRLDTL